MLAFGEEQLYVLSDFSLAASSGNSGDGNTCDKPGGWNDDWITGCTYSCSAPPVPTPAPFFPASAFLGIVLFAPLGAYLAARKR